MDYSSWPMPPGGMSVSKLLLDPRNPRIEGAGEHVSQNELIAELVEHDNVYNLARKIVREGYHATEVLIVVEENGQYVVREGNRRLAALKCLLSPSAAPEPHQAKFRRLAVKVSRDQIRKVRVIIAPDREAADVLVQSRHTATQIERWKPPMQAKFYREMVDAGQSITEISERFNVPPSRIQDFLRNDVLYRLACSVAEDLPEDVAEAVRNPRTFRLTTLERVVNSEAGRDYLQIEPADGTYRGKVKREEFLKGFKAVVREVAVGNLDSRVANKNKTIASHLEKHLSDARPDPKKRGRFRVDRLIKTTEKAVPDEEASPRQTTPRRSPKPTSIVTRDVRCTVHNQRVRDVFDELRKLPVKKFPNATAVTLRTLLELAMKGHLDATGKSRELIKRCRTGSRPKGWYPGIKEQLEFFVSDTDLCDSISQDGVRALKTLLQESNPVSLFLLNLYVHNQNVMPDEQSLRRIWEMLKPTLQVILLDQKGGNGQATKS